MTKEDFEREMVRLNEAHRNYYNKARVQALAPVIAHLEAETLRRFVDKAIWWEKPPTLESFGNLARNNRYVSKEQEKREFEENLTKVFSQGDVAEMFSMVKKKMAGKISRQEFDAYIETRERAIELTQK